ncbi:hypothetical protein BKA62DRAFT_674306 [Auriculariales sp. MPI-PUGE-AT-0066]|nr:hypothetical protein BKA62DRAFT_674306 [Auriculariales sp. MPI-PUGE-AT-0066]
MCGCKGGPVGRRGLLAIARRFSAQLADPDAPDVCALCLYDWTICKKGIVLVFPELLSNEHEFWNSIVRCVSLPRTDESEAFLAQRMVANMRACPTHALDGAKYDHPLSEDPVHLLHTFIDMLFQCLHFGLRVDQHGQHEVRADGGITQKRWMNPHRGVARSDGTWPRTREQLVPHGPKDSMEGYLRWVNRVSFARRFHVFTAMMFEAYPLMYPHISIQQDDPTRVVTTGVSISTLIRMMDPVAWRASVVNPELSLAPAEREFLESEAIPAVDAVTHFWAALLLCPCAGADDLDRVVSNTGMLLLVPAQNAMRNCITRKTQNGQQMVLAQVIMALYCSFPLTRPRKLAPDIAVICVYIDYNTLAFVAVAHHIRMRRCSGPGCKNEFSKETDDGASERPLRECSGCKQSRYCSRRCQKADWGYEKSPHKELCGTLRDFIGPDGFSLGGVKAFSELNFDAVNKVLMKLAHWGLVHDHVPLRYVYSLKRSPADLEIDCGLIEWAWARVQKPQVITSYLGRCVVDSVWYGEDPSVKGVCIEKEQKRSHNLDWRQPNVKLRQNEPRPKRGAPDGACLCSSNVCQSVFKESMAQAQSSESVIYARLHMRAIIGSPWRIVVHSSCRHPLAAADDGSRAGFTARYRSTLGYTLGARTRSLSNNQVIDIRSLLAVQQGGCTTGSCRCRRAHPAGDDQQRAGDELTPRWPWLIATPKRTAHGISDSDLKANFTFDPPTHLQPLALSLVNDRHHDSGAPNHGFQRTNCITSTPSELSFASTSKLHLMGSATQRKPVAVSISFRATRVTRLTSWRKLRYTSEQRDWPDVNSVETSSTLDAIGYFADSWPPQFPTDDGDYDAVVPFYF